MSYISHYTSILRSPVRSPGSLQFFLSDSGGLFDYARHYWGHHARETPPTLDDDVVESLCHDKLVRKSAKLFEIGGFF